MNPFEGYRITSPYGPRINPIRKTKEFHRGIDLVIAPKDGPIYAFVAGEVLHCKLGVKGSGFGNYGNVVAIRDAKGFLHVYAHLSSIVVKVGQSVERGQMIGRQGTTGLSTGEHLHYEVRKACSPSYGYTPTEAGVVEPTAYLQSMHGVVQPVKYSPEIIKERIVAVNGKLKYIDLNKPGAYSTKATDVRFMKLDKNKIGLAFKAVKGAKVSDLMKQFDADFAINFPYFDTPSKLPIGNVWDGKTMVNGSYGKVLNWHSFAAKGNKFVIQVIADPKQYDLAFPGSPKLVSNGRPSWDYYNTCDETAKDIGKDSRGNLIRCQRTFIGIDKNGDLLLAIADGRTSSDQGLTIEEMSLYMFDKGAIDALNGDGGGSTILAAKTGGHYANLDKTNKYCEYKAGGINQEDNTGSNERAGHHALLIYLK
jgi:hypothetical protein